MCFPWSQYSIRFLLLLTLVNQWTKVCQAQSTNATYLISRQRIPLSDINSSNNAILSLCKKSGIFAVPQLCWQYVVCRQPDQRTVIMEHYSCPPGLFYDSDIGQCRVIQLGETSCSVPVLDVTFNQISSQLPSSSTSSAQLLMTKTKLDKRSQNNQPLSYASELSGLSCKSSGFFAHPTNSTKFYRCVALHSNGSFMVYLFSCETGLLYEPTVGACVKSLGEEQMEGFPIGLETGVNKLSVISSNGDEIRNWEIERCRGQRNKPTSRLFRSPVNCRRFIRCSSTATAVKVERFSCPTGLFFDEATHACTWASETSSCNILDTSEDLQISIEAPSSGSLSSRATSPATTTATLATIWITNRSTAAPLIPALPNIRKTTVLSQSLRMATQMTSTENSQPAKVSLETTTNFLNWDGSTDSMMKQVLRPAPYLTATGVLVLDGSDFKCESTGSFPSGNPCVFFKCERYVWLPSFLLFRFQCPPHTIFINGTCQYTPYVDCSDTTQQDSDGMTGLGGQMDDSLPATSSSLKDLPEILTDPTFSPPWNNNGTTSDLCLKEGIFSLPYATPCSTRFMVCRYLSGPFHFFVSVHECPPSLIFSPSKKQCVDPSTTKLNCNTEVTSSLYVPGGSTAYTLQNSSNSYTFNQQDDTVGGLKSAMPACQMAGFSKLSCHRFRRCQWLTQSALWVSYDFECAKGMIFDVSITACVRPRDTVACQEDNVLIPGKETALVLQSTPQTSSTDKLIAWTPFSTTPVVRATTTTSQLPLNGYDKTAELINLPGYTLSVFEPSETTVGPVDNHTDTITDLVPNFALPTLQNLDKALTAEAPTTTIFKMSGKPPVCFRSGYFLYPADERCQRFYRCLQLTPEPNSFVMLHYRCDNGFVFDGQYSACTAGLSSPSCLQLQQAAGHNFVANDEAATGWAVTDIPLLATNNNKTTSPSQATLNRSPIKILPQIWQMAGQDSGSSGSASLVCTTQRIYRLQTCGYYYSCIEKEKGKFHLQEIYCETLYLDTSTGQCIEPPPQDPCSGKPYAGRNPSTTTPIPTNFFGTTFPSISLSSSTTTANTTTTLTKVEPDKVTFMPSNSTTPLQSLVMAQTIKSNTLTSTTTSPKSWPVSTDRISSSTKTGNESGSLKRVTLGTLLSSSRRPWPYRFRRPYLTTETSVALDQSSNQASVTSLSLSAYRETFNKLYAQLVNSQQDPSTTASLFSQSANQILATTQSALILNFNTVSGQLTNLTTGMTFQCRSEGYFRNSRDVSCSKFYLCVKVASRQYNLFEFMCLPHNGIQWRYNQNRNACVDPQDVTEC